MAPESSGLAACRLRVPPPSQKLSFLPDPAHVCAPQLRKETYSRLTPTQRLSVARHPNRPTCLDIILNITDKFVELHGDRGGLDDPAIVCGIGSMNGIPFMFIGHQKGRNTKVRARMEVHVAAAPLNSAAGKACDELRSPGCIHAPSTCLAWPGLVHDMA